MIINNMVRRWIRTYLGIEDAEQRIAALEVQARENLVMIEAPNGALSFPPEKYGYQRPLPRADAARLGFPPLETTGASR